MKKMCKKFKQTSQWSDIPPEILLIIGELTRNPFHHTQFRAVCNPWRSAFAHVENNVTKNFPLKVPDHPSLGHSTDIASLFVVKTISYMIRPTIGLQKGSVSLFTADEINPGYISPRYPLSGSNCGFWGVGKNEKRLDLLETGALLVDYGFSLRVLHARRRVLKKDMRENELSFRWQEESKKAIVLRNRRCEDDLWIVVLCRREKLMGLRVKDGKWKTVVDGEVSKCRDVVKFKEGIYGIDHLGRAFLIDYDFENGDFNIVDVAPSIEDYGGRAKRLVVDSSSNGNLYMAVLRTERSDIAFPVYRLNEKVGMWGETMSIGDKMFFVGVNLSFCVTSRDLPGLATSCKRSDPWNCIFFSKGSFPGRHYGKAGDDLLFGKKKEGTDMNIGQYCFGNRRATGILEPAFVIMFSPPM